MKEELLICASTERSADMLYFSKINIPDSFFAFTLNGKKCAILSPLEIGRVKKSKVFSEIFESSKDISDLDLLVKIFKANKVKRLLIPKDFPALAFAKLQEKGFGFSISNEAFLDERRFKTKAEIGEIKKANLAASVSYQRIWQILKDSKIEKSFLKWKGAFLSSEILKKEIELTCLQMGASSKHTIAAGGKQACDPHCEGFGRLKANELIVVDIFPQMNGSGYFGDMTRTFLKGYPSDAQIKLVNAVKTAQDLAISAIKDGVRADTVHSKVVKFFENSGYKTEHKNSAWQGFFHSTGHGLGLEVHEAPRLSTARNILKANEVVTVEPGLYYPEIGACRIEDNVCVTKNSCKKLSNFHYDWLIK